MRSDRRGLILVLIATVPAIMVIPAFAKGGSSGRTTVVRTIVPSTIKNPVPAAKAAASVVGALLPLPDDAGTVVDGLAVDGISVEGR